MGVDVNAFCLFGSYVSTNKIIGINYGENNSIETDNEIFIAESLIEKYNLEIIIEPYSRAWQVLGISFLHKDTVKTIDELIHIHNKWRNFILELKNNGINININILNEPSIIMEGYFC